MLSRPLPSSSLRPSSQNQSPQPAGIELPESFLSISSSHQTGKMSQIILPSCFVLLCHHHLVAFVSFFFVFVFINKPTKWCLSLRNTGTIQLEVVFVTDFLAGRSKGLQARLLS